MIISHFTRIYNQFIELVLFMGNYFLYWINKNIDPWGNANFICLFYSNASINELHFYLIFCKSFIYWKISFFDNLIDFFRFNLFICHIFNEIIRHSIFLPLLYLCFIINLNSFKKYFFSIICYYIIIVYSFSSTRKSFSLIIIGVAVYRDCFVRFWSNRKLT